MSTVAKIRRGTKAEIDAQTASLSELQHATDTSDIILGGNSGNVNITYDQRTNKIHKGVIVGSRISFTTGDRPYKYQEGGQVQFYVDSDITAPVTLTIDSGVELDVVDLQGFPVDVFANTIYVAFYHNDGTAVFQLAPRGGAVGGLKPIMGVNLESGGAGEVDLTTPETIFSGSNTTDGDKTIAELNNIIYQIIYVAGVGYKVIKRGDFPPVEAFRMDSASLGAEPTIVADESNEKIHIIGHNGSNTIYHWIVDPSQSGDLFGESMTLANTETTIGRTSAIIEDGKLFWAVQSSNTSYPDNDNVISQLMSIQVGGGSVVGDYPVEQTTQFSDTNLTVRGLSVGLDGGVPHMSLLFARIAQFRRDCLYIRRDNTLTSDAQISVNWSQTVIVANGVGVGVTCLHNKGAGSNIGRKFVSVDVNSVVFFYYSDNNGVSFTEVDMGVGVAPSLSEKTNGDIDFVYTSDGDVVGRTLIDGTTTPLSFQILIDGAFDAKALKKVYSYDKPPVTGRTGTSVKLYGKWSTVDLSPALLVENIRAGEYVYSNQETTIEFSAGGQQTIPAVNSASNESELIASGAGDLYGTGTSRSYVTGVISTQSLGYTPI